MKITDNKELMEAFKEDANTFIERMRSGLPELKNNGGNEKLQDMLRYAHTLRGSAGIVGYEIVEEIAWALEKVFWLTTKGEFEIDDISIPILSAGVEVCQKLVNDEETDDCIELLERLRKLKDDRTDS